MKFNEAWSILLSNIEKYIQNLPPEEEQKSTDQAFNALLLLKNFQQKNEEIFEHINELDKKELTVEEIYFYQNLKALNQQLLNFALPEEISSLLSDFFTSVVTPISNKRFLELKISALWNYLDAKLEVEISFLSIEKLGSELEVINAQDKLIYFIKKHKWLLNKVDKLDKQEITEQELKAFSKDLKELEAYLIKLSLPEKILISIATFFSFVLGVSLGGFIGALIGTAVPGAGTLIGGIAGATAGAAFFGGIAAIGIKKVLITDWQNAILNFVSVFEGKAKSLKAEQDVNYVSSNSIISAPNM